MSGYREIRFWSVILGCDASRIYIFDANGAEHFAVVPMNSSGRRNREVRHLTLEAIAAHIDAGKPAGEVVVDLTPREEIAV